MGDRRHGESKGQTWDVLFIQLHLVFLVVFLLEHGLRILSYEGVHLDEFECAMRIRRCGGWIWGLDGQEVKMKS